MKKVLKIKTNNGEILYILPYFPIGSIYSTTKSRNPAEDFGGTWQLKKEIGAGNLIAYGYSQNNVSNDSVVASNEILAYSDNRIKNKTFDIKNLVDGILVADSGTIKAHTKGIVGMIEATMALIK